MKSTWMAAITTLLLSPSAWAQGLPVYQSTGTLQLIIDGESTTYHTTSNTIPGQPDKMVHTANWRTFPPMMMGGVNLAPPGRLITLSAQPSVEPDASAPQLKILFTLHEDTPTLLESAKAEVTYTVKQGKLAGEYQHSPASLTLLSVTPLEADVLKISGRASGTLSPTSNGGGQGLSYDTEFTVNAHPH